MKKILVILFVLIALGALAAMSFAQTATPAPEVSKVKSMLGGILNMGGTLVIVAMLNAVVPALRSAVPWALPILAGIVGPLLAILQNWLGVSIDVDPIMAVFTGATATAVHQVYKQTQ